MIASGTHPTMYWGWFAMTAFLQHTLPASFSERARVCSLDSTAGFLLYYPQQEGFVWANS